MKFLKTLFFVCLCFCFLSPALANEQQVHESDNLYSYEKNQKRRRKYRNRMNRYPANKKFQRKIRGNKSNNKKFKSGSGVMLNLTSRFGESTSAFEAPSPLGVGSMEFSSKLNIFSANLDILYGFDFGLVLGATYFLFSSKSLSTNDVLGKKDQYKSDTQLYGPTIGYNHIHGENATGLFTLFTYFAGGTCSDTFITDCSVDNGYQLSLGWAFPVTSSEGFTLALGPQINFIETNFNNDKLKIKMKRKEFTPLIALWFMW